MRHLNWLRRILGPVWFNMALLSVAQTSPHVAYKQMVSVNRNAEREKRGSKIKERSEPFGREHANTQ